MSSSKQIEANRRNALKSTGPATADGKQRSRCNAVRHGLTAETVIGALEDAEDYKAFEAAITAEYDAQSAVERELVLRLASLLWRLRRATTMETGLFEIQAEHLRDFKRSRQIDAIDCHPDQERDGRRTSTEAQSNPSKFFASAADLAQCFLRLANLPSYAFDRLSRYEATLWRQVAQILFALEALERRKPQERARQLSLNSRPAPPVDDDGER
jgi:hypothetical protein